MEESRLLLHLFFEIDGKIFFFPFFFFLIKKKQLLVIVERRCLVSLTLGSLVLTWPRCLPC